GAKDLEIMNCLEQIRLARSIVTDDRRARIRYFEVECREVAEVPETELTEDEGRLSGRSLLLCRAHQLLFFTTEHTGHTGSEFIISPWKGDSELIMSAHEKH